MTIMHHTITLICNPANAALEQAHVDEVKASLENSGGVCGRVDWLAGRIACDLGCAGLSAGEIDGAARRAIGALPIDVVVQEAGEARRRKCLIADMDSTIITVECLDELADMAGKKAEISVITARAMRGEIVFEDSLRQRIAMLAGMPEIELARTYKERVRLTPGARALVRTMAANGAKTTLVSGGFSFFTERVAAAAGFDAERANRLLFTDGRLAGVAEPILGRAAKLQALREQCSVHGISPAEALAVGDGANDLAMIKEAGLGVAFRGKPLVRAEAPYAIDHGDLTTLLYFQGFREIEMV